MKNRRLQIMALCWLLFCGWFWLFLMSDFLYLSQEFDLFVWSRGYFLDHLHVPGGMLRYLTSFIVQFFYYSVLGGFLLVLLGVLLRRLTVGYWQIAFKEKVSHHVRIFFMSLVPMIIVMVFAGNVKYHLFQSADIPWCWSILTGTMVALLIARGARYFWSRLFLVAALYPLFGVWALYGGVLGLLRESIEKKGMRFTHWMLSFFLIAALPVFWFPVYQTEITFQGLYLSGLAESGVNTIDSQTLWILYSCFAVIMITLPLGLVFTGRWCRNESDITTKEVPSHSRGVVMTGGLILCMLTVFLATKNDSAYWTTLKMGQLLQSLQWDSMIGEESNVAEPVVPLILLRNLALYRTGKLADDGFKRPLIASRPVSAVHAGTKRIYGDRILFHSGHVNLAARCATNNWVLSRRRSVWALTTLTLCAVVNEEDKLVARYKETLNKTLFHRDVSERLLPKTANMKTEKALTSALSNEIMTVRYLRPAIDYYSDEQIVDLLVYRGFSNENIQVQSVERFETRLALRLIYNEPDLFASELDIFRQRFPSRILPVGVQQGALYSLYFNRKKVNLAPNIVSQTVLGRFNDYRRLYDTARSNPQLDAVCREELRYSFGDTYWYYRTVVDKYLYY